MKICKDSTTSYYAIKSFAQKHEKIVVAVFLILLITIFFLPTFIKGKLPLNSDYLLYFDPWRTEYSTGSSKINNVLSDSIDFRIPNRGFFNKSILKNEFPLWNPNINLGTPYGFLLFTDTFNISNITTIFFGAAWGSVLYYYLKLFIIGFFIFLFLRKRNMSTFSSLFGMVVSSFSSYIVVYLGTNVIDSVIYIPAMLYFGESYLNSSNYKHFIGLSITVMLTLLSGFPAITLFSILLSVGYFSFRILIEEKSPIRVRAIKLIQIAIGFVIGLFLSLFSLIPTYEFFDNIDLGYRVGRGSQRLSSIFLWRLVNGNICGNPVDGNYFCTSNYNETAIYVGLSPILLLPFSIIRKQTRKLSIFFILCVLFIFITVFGLGNFHTFIGSLPIFNLSSNTRLIALLPICMSIVSSIGLENIIKSHTQKKYILFIILYIFCFSIFILFLKKFNPYYETYAKFITKQILFSTIMSILIGLLLILFIKLENEYWKKVLILSIILLTFLDSGTKLYDYNGASNLKTFFPKTPGIDYLIENQEPYERMLPVSRRVMVPGFPLYFSLNSLLGRWWTSPEFRGVISLIDPEVFDSFVTTQPISELASLNLSSPLIDLFRVKHIVLPSSDLFTLNKTILADQVEYNTSQIFTFPNSYTQSTTSKRDQKINRLSLKISSQSSIKKIPIQFTLYIGGIRKIDKISELVKNPNENLFEIHFTAQDVKKNQDVRFEIVPLEVSTENRINYVNFDIYEDGQMKINEKPLNADLAFSLFFYEDNLRQDYSLVYDKEIKIYRNNDYTNSIPVVFSTIQVENDNCISALSNINPQDEALVFTQAENHLKDPNGEQNGNAEIVEYSNNNVVIQAELSEKGMVILSDQWFPGWIAQVDGKFQDILEVNCIMRGVIVEKGKHTIEIKYQPKSIKYGSMISGFTLLILLCYPLLRIFRKQSKK